MKGFSVNKSSMNICDCFHIINEIKNVYDLLREFHFSRFSQFHNIKKKGNIFVYPYEVIYKEDNILFIKICRQHLVE